ncbi:PYC2, partial [Symbiodinium sp. KB8]
LLHVEQDKNLWSPHKVPSCFLLQIAIRLLRAGTELGMQTVGVLVVTILLLCLGKCKENNITFVSAGCIMFQFFYLPMLQVGPTAELLELFGDKTSARNLAQKANVPIIPGSGAVKTLEEATEFADEAGYPVIIKAAFGGGGRGMRVVRSRKEMKEAAFGNGTVFLEKYIEDPRHIEVQILGDGKERLMVDNKLAVVESAPARHLPKGTREAILNDAVRLTSEANYLNAGTVEFLVDKQGNHYFIEVNPRVQVEHTVTEEVTGLDIVQSQILIASGKSLEELGLVQDKIEVNGAAIQCRITTEDPKTNFQPDSGILTEYRSASGNGIRLDDGPGYTGAHIQPHYDSLLVKVTAHSKTFEGAAKKLERALREYRIRGVTTNIGFLLNVLTHPEFVNKSVTTSFIAQNPDLVNDIGKNQNRGEKMLR